MKQFFKPTWKKVIISIILVAGFSLISVSLGLTQIKNDGTLVYSAGKGLPIPFYIQNFDDQGIPQGSHWFINGLLINLIFYYLISCSIIFLLRKYKENKHPRFQLEPKKK